MKKPALWALFLAGFLGGMAFVYSCGSGGGGGGGSAAVAAAMNVGTPISALPYTISSPGLYYVTKNLSIAGADGITVAVDDVTIDLMGFTLTGDDTAGNDGIVMSNRQNVEVRNGTVRDFDYGIHEDTATAVGHRIVDVRAISNVSDGIRLLGSGHRVKDCAAYSNLAAGIYAGGAANLSGNRAGFNGGHGIVASIGSVVIGNTAHSNTGTGISAGGSVLVASNAAYQNSGAGIAATAGSAVRGNAVGFNPGAGIASIGGAFIDSNAMEGNGTPQGTLNINCVSPCTVTANNHAP